MQIETPTFEHHAGFAFNSSDFAMTFPSTGTMLPPSGTATMEDWDKEDDEEGTKIEVEIDPDLEDGDEPNSTSEEGDEPSGGESGDGAEDDDDDEFEQYLFGENED
jgi:hypothetical protein